MRIDPRLLKERLGAVVDELMADPRFARAEQRLGELGYRALKGGLRRVLGAEERRYPVDGQRLPVLVREGEGPPLVFLHGFGADKEGWLPLLTRLGRERPWLAPDLPGFGEAEDVPRTKASARAQAAVVLELLDKAGHERVHLVGSSMGGGIALRLALDAPSRVASLCLLGSVGPWHSHSEVSSALECGRNPLLTSHAEDYDRLIALVAERPPPAPRPLRRYLGHRHATRREAFAQAFEGWLYPEEGEGVPETLSEVRAPALVVHGREDRVIPATTGELLADALREAEFLLLEGVGHLPHLEAPLEVSGSLRRFLRRVESRPGTAGPEEGNSGRGRQAHEDHHEPPTGRL